MVAMFEPRVGGRAEAYATPAASSPIMRASGVSKSFGRHIALQNVNLDIHAGEVHFVMGENGAGKSTLMNILSGALRADAGSILLDGVEVSFSGPSTAKAAGIAVIHQELALVPHLNVIENVMLGREIRGVVPGLISRKREFEAAQGILQRLGFSDDLRTPVHRLSTGKQQLIEIAKALSQSARILIMDEPTASIAENDCENLYSIIADLKRSGVGIVYISHRMKEVDRLADRVSILRDGQLVGSSLRAETTQDLIIQQMIGRNAEAVFTRSAFSARGDTLVKLEQVCSSAGLKNVSLEVSRGEIVGLAGLMGSGRTEVARAIFGADKITSGSLWFKGEASDPTPRMSVKKGIAFVPEDRKGQGLATERTIGENLVLPSLWKLFPSGVIVHKCCRELAKEIFDKLQISARGPSQLARKLSGGNQQKVVLGKWLPLDCDLFLIDEPTRGIDIGAKGEILKILEHLVTEGKGVLLISSELPELISACDRVYVMRDHSVAGCLSGNQITEAEIMRLTV
ncbi:sugar ABC transporter ATP-binding protein [Ensifer adhaerens]|uniref:sugar ABC transporter ATP-binding protein n=1 Tax=Ensifer adhaerens TaxID=106592 RepID=UPI001CBEC1A6|nr:sugar ABC transporter ATP-binding protein [Ensifer adhaerens]MBZ7924221.1 sugar ABC transporter ATP-binding protein [Ensifer adhaerens]UAX96525.1 sugar ABC transporter ATP-binding protein [Ensifer adhaerens]UAY04131.1 sugar ABC transporter ATP-binding protein [Ensifer adhaerens]UAY12117.1 sugar ABC transporter ATP-binding protein [Ensifer adhaerens]